VQEAGFCDGCCGYCLLGYGCCCLIHKPARVRFRAAYGLAEGSGLASDFCASCCCSVCGVCQEAREMKSRGNVYTYIYKFIILVVCIHCRPATNDNTCPTSGYKSTMKNNSGLKYLNHSTAIGF
jgi:hypothetical protein